MNSPELLLIDQAAESPKTDPAQPAAAIKRLLVIDDLPEVGALVLSIARKLGYMCDYAPGFEPFKRLLAGEPDVIVVDLVMPEIDGIEVLRFLGERQCRAGILLLSNSDRRILSVAQEMAQAMNLRVIGVMRKPFARTALESVLRREQTGTTPARPHAPVLPTITQAALRRAIDNGQIVLHYQPQVEIATGAVAGLELLIRLQHPQHGLVYPDAFIGLAESWGLIDELTWVVVDQTLEHHKTLTALGWEPTLSINVSAISLRDLKLPDILSQRAAAAGIPTARIILEITESGLVKNVAPALDILARLRLRGVSLSIDDFGTGFSMMHQLKRIPATEVKIDKSFIGMMAFDPDAEAIVRKTIELGHDLGMTVVAEGVETTEQLQMLRHLKCDLAQGYLFARPMPLHDVLSWRKTHLAEYPASARLL